MFAIVMAFAYCLAYPAMLTASRVLLMTWGYGWPVVLALTLTGPAGAAPKVLAVAAYFAPLVAFTVFDVLTPGAATSRLAAGGVAAQYAMITPPDVVRAWLQGNAPPTLLFLVFLNRRVRAVGSLVLGFVTLATAGSMVTLLALATRRGMAALGWLRDVSGFARAWWSLGIIVLAFVLSGVAAWWVLRGVRRGYLDKTLNDRSLTLDALWLMFGSWYAMWLSITGLVWASAALVAFFAYKLAWLALWAAAPTPQGAGRGLVFLRVFSLGRRSDRLFDALSRHWRHIGSLQMITGPDVAQSTVQPHQLLDFLSGRLEEHFVASPCGVERAMAGRDTQPDRDGWFRVNNFFCHADTWRSVLAALVRDGDAVLMDLRSFSPRNAGCVHELEHIANFVPLDRCVLLADASTDEPFVRATLREAWQHLVVDSPNRATEPDTVPLHAFGSGRAALHALLKRLCAAG